MSEEKPTLAELAAVMQKHIDEGPPVKRWYTVVGVYPEEWDGDEARFRTGSTYVEHVLAENVVDAIAEARSSAEEREEAAVVAVFEGSLYDVCPGDEEG